MTPSFVHWHVQQFLGFWDRSRKEADLVPALQKITAGGKGSLTTESYQRSVKGRAGNDVCLAGVV